jgi:16S rRNA (cytosine967-C5)-methyltransferase
MSLLNTVGIQKPREIAARVLNQRAAGAEYVETLLDAEFAKARLSPKDCALCQELVYGVVRWQAALDWLIARRTKGQTQKSVLRVLLRLGLYQIFWLDRIPDHAAVYETVELAKRNGFGAQSGFINAVLRGFLREFEATERSLAGLKATQPHLGYSHPEWLWTRWRDRWGAEKAAQLMAWNNTPPATYARANTLKTDAGKLLAQWRDEGVEYDFFRRNWTGENLVFELKSHPSLTKLASFQQGLFYVQDPSTLLAVHELNPRPGETVLDLCAAPGGKTTYIAQLMQNQGRIVAQDISSERLKLIQGNCRRLGVTCVESTPAPDTSHLAPHTSHFDKALVDVPCSNSGVMRRRVDLRWRMRLEEIERLRATQLGLLRQAPLALKPGGTLVYSTCSLEPEENGKVLEAFLSERPEFKLESERELLPFVDGVDGGYVAKLVRSSS